MITAAINWVALLLGAATVGLLAYHFSSKYSAATGTRWQRTLAASRNSATVLWARASWCFTWLSAWAIAAVDLVADASGRPEIKQAIDPYINPKWMMVYTLGIIALGYWARMRTLKT